MKQKEADVGYSPGKKARLVAAFAAGLGAGVASGVPPAGAEFTPQSEIAEAPLFDITGPENVCDRLDAISSSGGLATTGLTFLSSLPGFSVGRKGNDGEFIISRELPQNVSINFPRLPTTQAWFVTDAGGNCVWAGYPTEEPAKVEIKTPSKISPQETSQEISSISPEEASIPRYKEVTNWETYSSSGQDGYFFTETNGTRFPYDPTKGFSVSGDFWAAYKDNGGKDALGFPITRVFSFKGADTQLFESAVLIRGEDGQTNVSQEHELLNNRSLIPAQAKSLEMPSDTPPEVAMGPEPWGKTFSFGGGKLRIMNDRISAGQVTSMEGIEKLLEIINNPNSKIRSFTLVFADGIEKEYSKGYPGGYPIWSSSEVANLIRGALVASKTKDSFFTGDTMLSVNSGFIKGPTAERDMYYVLAPYQSFDKLSTTIITGVELGAWFGDGLSHSGSWPDWLSPLVFHFFRRESSYPLQYLGRPIGIEEGK